jgi:hypothetical protein
MMTADGESCTPVPLARGRAHSIPRPPGSIREVDLERVGSGGWVDELANSVFWLPEYFGAAA